MSASPSVTPSPAPRFSWRMRVLLFVILFHMSFRGTDVLYPWKTWLVELKLTPLPRPLPTRADLAKLREAADGSPVLHEYKECGVSLIRFWNFTPTDETRETLTAPTEWIKYGLAWTATRLAWCERILGLQGHWAMFAPDLRRQKYVTRARLLYDDGSEVTIRSRSEPEDLTSYSRWTQCKRLGIDGFTSEDHPWRFSACPGYCNLLTHRFARNPHGSSLRTIVLYEVRLSFVPPGADPYEFLGEQMTRTRDYEAPQARWAFFTYAVADQTWRFIAWEEKYPPPPRREVFGKLAE